MLKQTPVLWIWDNVERVGGFRTGADSAWSSEEQEDLRAFLVAAQETQAKFLLTSRRDERAWLGDLAYRVQVPPMPMQERLEFASAILESCGRHLVDLPDMRPLLRFTQGNPLTVQATIGEVLRACIDSQERLDAFITDLRSGEAEFVADENIEGRTKSLAASLAYGFEHAFCEKEHKILALLHLFHDFVNVDILCAMGHPEAHWNLEAVRGLSRAQARKLLNLAGEIGLLTALQGGFYFRIHPALPWFFRGLFAHHYPEASGEAGRARRAFLEVISAFNAFYAHQYMEGQSNLLHSLILEENNLLAAQSLARAERNFHLLIRLMEGFHVLYQHTRRRAAFYRLVEEMVPDLVDSQTDGPLPDRAAEWSVLSDYRVEQAMDQRRWDDALRLHLINHNWRRQDACPLLAVAPEQRNAEHHVKILNLLASTHTLAQIQFERGDPACADTYREAFNLAGSAGSTGRQAAAAMTLGNAYKDLAAICDLAQAEYWFKRSFELRGANDLIGRGKSLNQLGAIWLKRSQESFSKKASQDVLKREILEAAKYYDSAVKTLPATAFTDRHVSEHNLGLIWQSVGNFNRALQHLQRAIRYADREENGYAAAQSRAEASHVLFLAGRLRDARLYAEATLMSLSSFGDHAAAATRKTQQLLAIIDARIAEKSSDV